MSDHDPLCPVARHGMSQPCWCPLIENARADERERIAAAIEAEPLPHHSPTWSDGWLSGRNAAARIARKGGGDAVSDAREMTPEYIQIRSDFQRWVSDNDGIQALRRLDMPRFTNLINQCVANNPDVNSTTVWRLLTPDGSDVALINRRLRELVP